MTSTPKKMTCVHAWSICLALLIGPFTTSTAHSSQEHKKTPPEPSEVPATALPRALAARVTGHLNGTYGFALEGVMKRPLSYTRSSIFIDLSLMFLTQNPDFFFLRSLDSLGGAASFSFLGLAMHPTWLRNP